MLERVSNSPANPLAKAILSKGGKRLWIISGPSGTGKTTWCLDLIAEARNANLTVGGLLCPAVFQDGVKVGIDQTDISSGERRRLGLRVTSNENTLAICWQMDESIVAWGNEILRALGNEDVIVIDELGPLEFEFERGYQEALRLLDDGRFHTVIVVVRPSLLPLVQARWPQAEILRPESETP